MEKVQQSNREAAMDCFVTVFKHLVKLHKDREKFVLNWIWNDQKALTLFLKKVLGMESCSKQLLANGYRLCRRNQFDVFPTSAWAKIDEVFLNKRLLSSLPKPIRKLLISLQSFSKSELARLLVDSQSIVDSDTQYSHGWTKVHTVSGDILKTMSDCFLGEWLTDPNQIFEPELAKICRRFPQECVLARSIGNFTYFYERTSKSEADIIAVHLKGALEQPTLQYMRSLMEELFVSHPKIVRQSMATLDSHMTGFGRFWHRYILDGGSKVSFYTHVEKLQTVLKDLPLAHEFQIIADRYAHKHLSELILALFIWKLSMLVTSFFAYSQPYLGPSDYEMSSLEHELGIGGPCAYQLFITKNFCSQIHKDIDTSRFTLSYCSHSNASTTTPVQFIMAEHGFRIPIEDGSLFGFKSSAAHGTAYRNPTHSAAYMGCLMVNSSLHALTQRRRLL